MTALGLFDTLQGIALGLLLFYTPFAALMTLTFITAVLVVEAAEIDGAGEFAMKGGAPPSGAGFDLYGDLPQMAGTTSSSLSSCQGLTTATSL